MKTATRSWGVKVCSRTRLVLSLSLVGLGCGGCTGDQSSPSASAAPGAEIIQAGAPTPLDNDKCRPGLVAPSGHGAMLELPSFGGSDVFVQDINNSGVVVGSQRAKDGNFHAFLYSDETGLQDLGVRGSGFASAIASDGSISGHFDRGEGTGTLFGYRYTATGGLVPVCSTPCSIWDLNAHEQMVGLMIDPTDALKWQAFTFEPGTGTRLLGTLGGARSSAAGISDAGLVVGNAQVAGSAPGDIGHAFVYDAKNGMRDLNVLAGTSGSGWILKAASDVSATQIAGSGTYQGHMRPFLFDLATNSVRGLGTWDERDAYGTALDAHGDVVGWSALSDRLNEAIVYSPNFGLRRLVDFVDPAEGWDLQQAGGMNDNGQIVGWGYHAGAARGFRLTLPLCH
jgi:probable HAF family extracellular repeat protein